MDILFQLNINDYQGVRSLQLIVQDLKPAEAETRRHERSMNRLSEVLEGSPIREEEGLVPNRDDIACVFTILRNDARLGRLTITERGLLERINRTSIGDGTPMDCIKVRLILRILGEMGVSTVTEPDVGIFTFEVNFDAPKTSIDASPLMQSLRRQLEAGRV